MWHLIPFNLYYYFHSCILILSSICSYSHWPLVSHIPISVTSFIQLDTKCHRIFSLLSWCMANGNDSKLMWLRTRHKRSQREWSQLSVRSETEGNWTVSTPILSAFPGVIRGEKILITFACLFFLFNHSCINLDFFLFRCVQRLDNWPMTGIILFLSNRNFFV